MEKLAWEKQRLVQELHEDIENLDNGEIVDRFRDERRRIVYYDEEQKKYFVVENGNEKYLSPADILSDFTWGISYVPDGEMIEPAHRTIAKKILVNETRRQLEKIYNIELNLIETNKSGLGLMGETLIDAKFEKRWLINPKVGRKSGIVAEAMARETVARSVGQFEFSLFVGRVNVLEDAKYKYDFKVRARLKTRGVGIGEEEELKERLKKIGFQFTIQGNRNALNKKIHSVLKAKNEFKDELPVDDIVFISMPTREFAECYDRWLKGGKPSGGPE